MLCDDFLNMRKVMRDFLNERIENVDITDTADLMALASLLQASRRLELDDGYGAGEGGYLSDNISKLITRCIEERKENPTIYLYRAIAELLKYF